MEANSRYSVYTKIAQQMKVHILNQVQVNLMVDVTDTTVMPPYYGHNRHVYSTDPL